MTPPLRITVLGLWHLGSVTAACCAKHFQVAGLDSNAATVTGLNSARAPLFEPGLNELIASGLAAKRLSFHTDPTAACANTDVLWVCIDTPVNDDDEADVAAVLNQIRSTLPHLRREALVLISAQMPVGTCKQLETEFPNHRFACSPENLRLGKAIEAFEKPARVIAGIRDDSSRAALTRLFEPFTREVLFMRTESAEMVKHALNSFLALSITFVNEIARLCEHVGADAGEVASGLKSEPRIGPGAYLNPGGPFAGGTLARDVVALDRLANARNEKLSLIPAIKQSNDLHRGWMFGRLKSSLGDLRGRAIAVLGLTYKPGTDTLRRSAAIELCRKLIDAGAKVRAFDPVVKTLPADLSGISLAADAPGALAGADAAVLCTPWPQFRQIAWHDAIKGMRRPLVVDAGRFLQMELKEVPGVEHLSVGRTL